MYVYIVCQMLVCQLLLNKCHIVVTLSGSVSGRTIPFLLTRLSVKNVDVRNWSTMVFDYLCILHLLMFIMLLADSFG